MTYLHITSSRSRYYYALTDENDFIGTWRYALFSQPESTQHPQYARK